MLKLVFICLFIYGNCCVSQNNDVQAGLYNLVSGAVIGGVGALINKKPNENNGRVLLKGIGQGALGGYLAFESKRLLRNFGATGNYAYVWPSRLVNAAGNSIVLNAAANRNFWERYYLDIGFGHLEYDSKKEQRFSIRALPFSLIGTIDGFLHGRFDVKRSLYTGVLFFESSRFDEFGGWAVYNNVSIHTDVLENRSELIAHELLHVYQYQRLIGINSFIPTPIAFRSKTEFWKAYHSIFYTDWNGLAHTSLYALDRSINSAHGDRLHEKEADYYEHK